MSFFNRRNRPADVDTQAVVAPSSENHSHHDRSRKPYGCSELNVRPGFGQWLKLTWPDILTMIVMGSIGLGVYEAPPAPNRSFPVYYSNGEVVYPENAYPRRHEIIPIYAAALLAVLVPILVFLFMQIRIRSFWDVNNAIIGLLYSVITAAVFQVFLKWLIGGLRPHFLDVCKPDTAQIGAQSGNGFGRIMYDKSVCTGDENEINDSLESFPNGHTTAAFAGFVFLYLYLNAKLKVWSNYHPAYWKLIVTYMPILGAVLIGGALIIDEYHHWWDILAGAIIGTVMAFSAYRMVYASVWDFRFNHIPLNRGMPFTYTMALGSYEGFQSAMWTRQASWGVEGHDMGGAPFDVWSGGHSALSAAVHGLGGTGQRIMSKKPVAGLREPVRGDHMV